MDTTLVRLGIPGIALALVGLFVYTTWLTGRALDPAARTRRTLGVGVGMALWLVATALLAASGLLARFELRPPPFAVVFILTLVSTAALAWSPFGKRFATELPFVALIGFQAFRLPLELVMHRAAAARIMPEVMTFTGYNFDIVSGATALLLGLYAWRSKRPLPRPLIALWNIAGQILLFVIVGVAFAATPVFRAFGDDQLNTWVAEFPYIWIAVPVAAALFGHIVTMRKLVAERRAARPGAPARAAAAAS
jgi:drug/metabolite transporter (DMT)-like permease